MLKETSKRMMLIVVGFLTLVFTDSVHAQQVKISDSGAKEVETEFHGREITQIRRNIRITTGSSLHYSFKYWYFPVPRVAEWQGKPEHIKFPYIGDNGAAGSGLGFGVSSWYPEGFLGVYVNGKSLKKTIAKEIKVVQQGERGVVDFLWEPTWATIKARFVFLPGDDKVYTEITLDPKEPVKSLELQTLCRPGVSTQRPFDRWLCTDKRIFQQSEQPSVSLDPKQEQWILYFDTRHTGGVCAIMYLPEEVATVEVQPARTLVLSHFIINPEIRKIHLIFWNLSSSYKKKQETHQYLKEHGTELLENLRKFNFGELRFVKQPGGASNKNNRESVKFARGSESLQKGFDICSSEWKFICGAHNLLKLYASGMVNGL